MQRPTSRCLQLRLIFGNIVYETSNVLERTVVVLNDIHIDIMDYISPAVCTDAAFRIMWAEFEWENKVAVNTVIQDEKEFLDHIINSTNMKCLTAPFLHIVVEMLEKGCKGFSFPTKTTLKSSFKFATHVAEHGSSMSKLHAPAWRLYRLYLHVCKDGSRSRRANAATIAVSGLALVAKACGNDVPRPQYVWVSIFSSSTNISNTQPLDINFSTEESKRRLFNRSKQRGFLELDLVLGKWVEVHIYSMDENGIKALFRVLDLENPELWKWLTAQEQPSEAVSINPVFSAVQEKALKNLNNHSAPETCATPGQSWQRRKSQKFDIWPASSTGVWDNAHESVTDPFISPFFCNAPVSDPKDVLQDKCFDDEATW
ncbi:hypothetical protein REPUB_Repub08aG0026100 [Reevesia pubescens]